MVAAIAFGAVWGRGRPGLKVHCGSNGGDGDLPSDEELMKSLHKRLPPEVRINKERALRAEETLRKADEAIKALGIDLTADDKEQHQLLPKPADAQVLLCLPSPEGSTGGSFLLEALQVKMGQVIEKVLVLSQMHELSAQEFKD